MKGALLLAGCLLCTVTRPGGSDATPAGARPGLADLAWLLGDWRAEAGERVVLEHWRAVSADTWEGEGETRGAADGALRESESLRLVVMAGEVYYLAKVPHNPLPVAFRLSEGGDRSAVFTNPDHDFPRRIEYHLGDGVLTVRVSDGGEKGFELRFTRPAP